MHWTTTAVAAVTQVVFNVAQGILGVYVSSSNLSLYGLLLFFIVGLFVSNLVIVTVLALVYRDWTFFLIADTAAERSVFRKHKDGRWTLAQLMLCLSGINAIAAISSWYSTPAQRTPPVIQAIMQSVPVITAIPLSKLVLGDRKQYTQWMPMTAMGLIAASLVVSIVPAALAGDGPTSGEAIRDVVAWSLMCLAAQVPTGCALVCQQAFLMRAGAADARATHKHTLKAMFRMLLYNQVFVLAYVSAFFWLDIVPWFGSSDSLATFSEGAAYSFQCAILGPSGVSSLPPGLGGHSSCTPRTPVYALSFIAAYVGMLIGVTVLNIESAVFNTICFIFNTAAQAVFWLIPGTNPDGSAQHAPIWSIVVALVLSLAGVLLFKIWEARVPVERQFRFASTMGTSLVADRDDGEEGIEGVAKPPPPASYGSGAVGSLNGGGGAAAGRAGSYLPLDDSTGSIGGAGDGPAFTEGAVDVLDVNHPMWAVMMRRVATS